MEDEKSVQSIDHFVQNPANLRTEIEQREQSTRGKNSKNIVGMFQSYVRRFFFNILYNFVKLLKCIY